MEIKELIGKVINNISKGERIDDSYSWGDTSLLTLNCDCGKSFAFYHSQDCCESVYLESPTLDEIRAILCGEEILQADEETNSGTDGDYGDSYTWTFYKLATKKGYLTLRFYGSSKGYYSESVNLTELNKSA